MPVRTYRKWLQGSSAASDPATGEYNSENAQVYENGTLGPRPGWKEIAEASEDFIPGTDLIRGFLWRRDSTDAEELVVVYADVSDSSTLKFEQGDHTTSPGTVTWGTQTSVGIGNTVPDGSFPAEYDDNIKVSTWFDGVQMTSIGAKVYSVFPSTGVVITTGDGQPSVATVYRERMYYWGIDSHPGRVYYSIAGNYANWDDGTAAGDSTWPDSTTFFDVSIDPTLPTAAITGMWAIKNALLISRKDGRWLVLTGASPENGTLRELGVDRIPDYNSGAVVNNQLFFLSTTAQGVNIASPSVVESKALEYLSPTAYPASTEARPENTFLPGISVGDDVQGNLYLPGRKVSDDDQLVAVERVNGVFNLSRWDYDTATPQDVLFTGGRPGEMYAMVPESGDWPVYSRDFTLNRPANSGDTKSVSLANEDGTSSGTDVVVDLGEIVADEGKVISPVKVVLDIDYWKDGNYSDPELAVDATIMGCVGEGATPEDSLTQQTETVTSWTASVGDLPYKRRVPVALPHGQFGTRFRIRLTFDNIAIDRVQVYYNEQTDPR